MSPAKAAIERAEARLSARDLSAARLAFEQAAWLGWDADHCSGGLWLTSMLAGNFEAAWREGDAIRARGAPDEHRFWNGEDIAGKQVIVRSLHGLGDAVQMFRFAPRLSAMAGSVVWEVAPRLVALARCFSGVDQVITWGEGAPRVPPVWDVQVEIMELPYLLRLQLDELQGRLAGVFPSAAGYLWLPAEVVARAATAMGQSARRRAGLVWSCGEWNPTRCISPELLEPMLTAASAQVEFWSLESSRHAQEVAQLGLLDASALVGDGLLAMAATIANLDLVITVDTLAAHLAGALGKPVWLLLQHAADWRWMVNRDDSPWYPSMRLFRQPRPGDWAGVVERVSGELLAWRVAYDELLRTRL